MNILESGGMTDGIFGLYCMSDGYLVEEMSCNLLQIISFVHS